MPQAARARGACARAKRNALVVDALDAEEVDELAEARDRVFLHLLERDEEHAPRAELVGRARNARRVATVQARAMAGAAVN